MVLSGGKTCILSKAIVGLYFSVQITEICDAELRVRRPDQGQAGWGATSPVVDDESCLNTANFVVQRAGLVIWGTSNGFGSLTGTFLCEPFPMACIVGYIKKAGTMLLMGVKQKHDEAIFFLGFSCLVSRLSTLEQGKKKTKKTLDCGSIALSQCKWVFVVLLSKHLIFFFALHGVKRKKGIS